MVDIDRLSHQLMIVAGIPMCVFGVVGNILNVCVFTVWCRFRRKAHQHHHGEGTSNSPLYLLVSSMANLIVVCYSLSTRILFDGYQYRVTTQSVFILCRLRYYCLHTFDLISLTCLCLATCDRYLISSRQVFLRRLSATRKGTYLIILLLNICLFLHGLPIAIYYDVSTLGQCYIDSPTYLYYYRYIVQILLHGLLPLIFFTIFGLLTFHQLKIFRDREHRQHNIHVDKQLSRMLFLMSVAIVFSSTPYTAESIYYLIFADRSQQQTSYIFLFHTISSILFYTYSVCSFYIFYISTPNFRHQVHKLILCRKGAHRFRQNRVNTITTTHD